MNIKNVLLFLISSILLIACKAEIVELDIKAKDVFAAVDGEAHLFYKDTINGKISMKFDGGIFNKLGAGLFLKENL